MFRLVIIGLVAGGVYLAGVKTGKQLSEPKILRLEMEKRQILAEAEKKRTQFNEELRKARVDSGAVDKPSERVQSNHDKFCRDC